MSLRLLHLSDIHFGGYGPVWDEDEDQRAQVLEDVRRLVIAGGPINGILVGGDIAYSGHPNQYQRAQTWLSDLVACCECEIEDVWVIPGNHDVDRSMLERSPILQDFRTAVRTCESGTLDDVLRLRLANDPASTGLVCTLDAYNKFAFPWGCSASSSKFHWKDDSLRLDELPVILWGMNSVLLSDGTDSSNDPKNGTTASLVLGRHQCQIPLVAGTVRIVLVHHPPNWVKDWGEVSPYMSRAHVVLFGHEHTYRAEQPESGGMVFVHAGAVGPESGPDWSPSFNVLTFERSGDALRLVVEPRAWLTDRTCFGPHVDGNSDFTIPLEPGGETVEIPLSDDDADENEPAAATPLTDAPGDDGDTNVGTAPDLRRRLVFRFLSQPPTRREQIARRLGVFEDADIGLPEGELYAAVLRRIRDRNLIDDLAEELGV